MRPRLIREFVRQGWELVEVGWRQRAYGPPLRRYWRLRFPEPARSTGLIVETGFGSGRMADHATYNPGDGQLYGTTDVSAVRTLAHHRPRPAAAVLAVPGVTRLAAWPVSAGKGR